MRFYEALCFLRTSKQPTRNVVIRVALELGLFEKLGSEGEKTLDQLAEGVQADKELICTFPPLLPYSIFMAEISRRTQLTATLQHVP
jgi:hypothetical protein